MLLSRFWYLFLATAVTAAVAAYLLAQSAVNGEAEEALGKGLQRDSAMVDAMLRLEARSRLDRIAFISVDGKLGALLKQASGITDANRLEDLKAAVKGLMQMHVGRIAEAASEAGSGQTPRDLEPDLAFALDEGGRIIAQLGPLEANPPGTSLATFPLVRRALQGYVRDDVWVYDRRVYRMAARPVFAGSEYAGAIVHGYRLEKGLLDKLSRSLGGTTLAFFHNKELLGSYVPSGTAGAPQSVELTSALPAVFGDAKFKAGERSQAIALQSGGRAVFDHVTGSAAALGVGYVLARPLHPLSSPLQLLQQASQDDVKALPLPWLIGVALLLGLVGLAFLYLERDRHMKDLMRKTGQIGEGERDRLIVTEWRGSYRALADSINQALEKTGEKAGERAPVARKKANLDDILGHTPESNVTPFFSFASDEPAVAKPAVAAAPAPAAAPVAVASPPKPAAPKAPAPARAPNRAAVAEVEAASSALQMAEFSLPPPAPSPPPVAPPQASPAPAIAPPQPAAARGASMTGLKAVEAEGGEDGHWREVYEAYIATRKQCGEPTDNLTFEKFGVTLRKTRDQIIDKQGVKSVRFSVQVKEGKAALKAQPIKR